jgi:hypothetical protein
MAITGHTGTGRAPPHGGDKSPQTVGVAGSDGEPNDGPVDDAHWPLSEGTCT